MNGSFYDMDDWLKLIETERNKSLSEGAQWWISRLRSKSDIYAYS